MKGIDGAVIGKDTIASFIGSDETQTTNPEFTTNRNDRNNAISTWIANNPEPVFQGPGFETEDQSAFDARHLVWQEAKDAFTAEYDTAHPTPNEFIFNIVDPENNAPLHVEEKELISPRDEPTRVTERTDDFKATVIPRGGKPPIVVQPSDSARHVPSDEEYNIPPR